MSKLKRIRFIGLSIIVKIVIGLITLLFLIGNVQALDQPVNIVCRAFENVNDQVLITWEDRSLDETGYRIQRRIDDDGIWSDLADLPADSKKYLDTGLDTSKTYRYCVAPLDGDTVGPYSEVCRKPLNFDSVNDYFRVFYRPYPDTDAPPYNGRRMSVPANTNPAGENEYASRIAGILVDSRNAFMNVGFDDVAFFDNDRLLPVELHWCDGGGCSMAPSWGNGRKGSIVLAPDFMGPYDPSTGIGDPSSVIISMHELFHQQQYTYGGLRGDPAGNWCWEGQARSIQDKICLEEDVNGNCSFSLDSIAGGSSNYLGQVNGYLSNLNRPITEISYDAVLFWTYLTEQYGTPNREPDIGMDLLVEFWEQARSDLDDDGIGTLNRALAAMGHTARFRDIFKDFAVANYAKDLTGPSVPSKYQYADEKQPPGSYRSVRFDVNDSLGVGDQVGPTTDDIQEWCIRYYQIQPNVLVPVINVEFRQDTSNDLYYTLLAIKGNDIALEINQESQDFVKTFVNDAYERVVVVVAGLENFANFRYSFNATQPVLKIVEPIQGRPAQAGDPSAPDKILVKVEILSPSGALPVSGINPGDIEITIGTQMVLGSHAISSAEVQGQYWLLIRAPTQTGGSGFYNLTVNYTTLTDTEIQGVRYSTQADTDNVLIIDCSGSMGIPPSKIQDAKDAARLYVDAWRDGDKIGVVSYNQSAVVELKLDDWDDTPDASRDQAITKIKDLIASGGTSIGSALETGQRELIDRGDGTHDWTMVLLSDGRNTVGKTPYEFLSEDYMPRQSNGNKVPRIHTVALGIDADRATMEYIALETNGTYHYAAEPPTTSMFQALAAESVSAPDFVWRELAEIYRVIGETVALQQQIFSARDTIPRGIPAESNIHEIRVDGSAKEAIFTFKWGPTISVPLDAEVTITRPDGVILTDPTLVDTRHLVWRIPNPMAGVWLMTVTGEGGCEFCASDYLVEAAVKSDLTIDVFLRLALEDRLIGRPMPILVSLSDTLPILGASVNVQVTDPIGGIFSLTLFDDGLHVDGAADDGFYGNTFYKTSLGGSYNVVVTATGTSNLDEVFQRRLRASFNMDNRPENVPDTDGDELPDWWEIEWGTDPSIDDRGQNPDGDGVTNDEEFKDGTDPLDSDTDNGGENDGSENDRGSDPHDPIDDGIKQPRAFAWPGVSRVWVLHTVKPNYLEMQFYRSFGPDGPFDLVATGVSPNEWWIDYDVTNGTEYCYRVTAVDSSGKISASSNTTCTSPKADPIPPTGGIIINGGALITVSRDVELTLFAYDNPEEDEHEIIFDDTRRFPPRDREEAQASGVEEMMISNDGAFSGIPWEPYVSRKDWQLIEIEEGPATVYVKYRDGADNESDIFHATIEVLLDSDGDGIPDDFDSCPNSSSEPIIIIDDCIAKYKSNYVENQLFDDGCKMSDLIAQCTDNVKIQGEFVSCVSHLTEDWKKRGLISGKEKDSIQRCAAQANIP